VFCRIDVAHYLQQHPAPSGRELKSWNPSWEAPNVMFWNSMQSGSLEFMAWHSPIHGISLTSGILGFLPLH
jgi:hypothetical protein